MIDVFSAILFIFGLFFFGYFVYSVPKQNNSISAPFSALSLTTAIYVIGYGFELQAENLKMIEFFLDFEYFGISFIPAFWFIVCYKYHYKRKVPIKLLIPIMTIPVLTLFFRVTNDYHHLMYTNLSVIHAYGHTLAVSSKGLWYIVHICFYFAALIFGQVIYFRDWQKCGFKIKSQSFWMFLSPLLPSVMLMIYLLGRAPLKLDLTPFGLTLSACMVFIALFRYDFLELNEMIKEITFLEINEGILVVNDRNLLIDFNKAGSRFFHWLDPNQIGMDISGFTEGRRILKQKEDHFELEIQREDKRYYLEFRKTVLKENNKKIGAVYFIQDRTKQKKTLLALSHMAAYDSLTELYNRRKLMEIAIKEMEKAKSLGYCMSALMIDIDHFKITNDQYGHLAGDEVLKKIAHICEEKIGNNGIIGRYGGEEFFALLPGVDKREAFGTAEEIRKSIAEAMVFYMDQELQTTVSIGLDAEVIIPEGFSLDQLISKADKALYVAKAKGRNQVSF